jgi:hypothetical protein
VLLSFDGILTLMTENYPNFEGSGDGWWRGGDTIKLEHDDGSSGGSGIGARDREYGDRIN